MTRKSFIGSALAAAAAGGIPTVVCAAEEDWKTAFRKGGFDPDAPGSSVFVVTSDIHASRTGDKLAGHVDFWNAMRPKPVFAVSLGDMLDLNAYFGERPDAKRVAARLAVSLPVMKKSFLDRLDPDIARMLVVGNHDTYPLEDDRKVWRECFPDQPPYGVRDFCGIRFMKWDGGGDGLIRGAQEKWIMEQCAAWPNEKPLVILVHQPSVGSTGMERDIGRMARKALADRPGVTWMLAGHVHSNGQSMWRLPGGGTLVVASHTTDQKGWWAYGVRDGKFVARVFKAEDKSGFATMDTPMKGTVCPNIPLAWEGRTDVVWKTFVGDAEEMSCRLEVLKTGDNVGAFFYVGKLLYRFDKAKRASAAKTFAVLGNLCGQRKTKQPARLFMSADGVDWIESVRTGSTGGVVSFPIPEKLVDARDLYVKYDGFGMGGDESIAGFAFLV